MKAVIVWSPVKVLGHLIAGEKTDWIVRAKIILEQRSETIFKPFDMKFQDKYTSSKSTDELLEEFEILRDKNMQELEKLKISEEDLNKSAVHPSLGSVTMKQLLSTWAVHDLGHISQISRVIAKQFKTDVGPWAEYLRIVK